METKTKEILSRSWFNKIDLKINKRTTNETLR